MCEWLVVLELQWLEAAVFLFGRVGDSAAEPLA